MTYRSESRGLLYTSPPTGDDVGETAVDDTDETRAKAEATDATAPDDAAECRTATPELEPTSSTTDANWTGTVPADD